MGPTVSTNKCHTPIGPLITFNFRGMFPPFGRNPSLSFSLSLCKLTPFLGLAMASSKTIREFYPPAKRLKVSETTSGSNPDKTDEGILRSDSPSSLTDKQKAGIEIKKSLAISKRNLRVCTERVSKSKADGVDYVKLEDLLVEGTWLEALPGELQKPYAKNLCKFVERELRGSAPIYPPSHLIFNALNSTPFDRLKVVIIGQDPYHGPGQAMGLAFSVPVGVKVPSSLVNIFKELQKDLSCSIPSHGNLERWAIQGVLLLNTVLTGEITLHPSNFFFPVRHHEANSHAKKGWEPFTDAVIQAISKKKSGVVFLLWGNSAQKKAILIDDKKHHILRAAHPSGLSANRGFFGCRHFSETNKILEKMDIFPIDWQL